MQSFELKEGLTNFYKKEYSEYSDVEILNVDRMSEGFESIIYSYELKYSTEERKIQKKMMIKLFPGKEGAYKAQKEFNLLASLMLTTIQVPDAFRIELDNSFDLPFIILEFIEGELLSKRMFKEPDKQDHYVNQISRILVDIHSVEWETMILESDTYKITDSSYHYLARILNDYKDKIENFSKLEFLPLLRWLVERMDSVSEVGLSLVHGDFHIANIMIDEQDELYVIDWMNATIGDFRVDLAWSLIVHETNIGKHIRDRILNSYRDYAQFEVPDIKYFEVLAIFRQILDMSINFNYETEMTRLSPSTVDSMKNNLIPIKKGLSILYGHTKIKIEQFEKMLD